MRLRVAWVNRHGTESAVHYTWNLTGPALCGQHLGDYFLIVPDEYGFLCATCKERALVIDNSERKED